MLRIISLLFFLHFASYAMNNPTNATPPPATLAKKEPPADSNQSAPPRHESHFQNRSPHAPATSNGPSKPIAASRADLCGNAAPSGALKPASGVAAIEASAAGPAMSDPNVEVGIDALSENAGPEDGQEAENWRKHLLEMARNVRILREWAKGRGIAAYGAKAELLGRMAKEMASRGVNAPELPVVEVRGLPKRRGSDKRRVAGEARG